MKNSFSLEILTRKFFYNALICFLYLFVFLFQIFVSYYNHIIIIFKFELKLE